MDRLLSCLVAPLLLTACIAEVPRADSDVEADAGAASAPGPRSRPDAAVAPPPLDLRPAPCGDEAIAAPGAEVASWVGDHLVLATAGPPLLARREGDRVRLLGEWRDGSRAATPERARLWVSGSVALRVSAASELELLDVSDPAAPRTLATDPFDGLDPALPAIVADAEGFAFCHEESLRRVRPEPADGHVVVDAIEGWACRSASARRAAGGHLLSLHRISGPFTGPAFAVHRLDDALDRALVDLSFNPSGVHAYGDILAGAVSDRRAYVDVVSSRYGWVLDLDPDARQRIHSPALPTSGAERLLGLTGAHALFSEAGRVWAMDLEDPDAPRRTTPDWPAADDVSLLAAEDEHFVLRHGDGTVAVHRIGSADPLGWVRDTCP